jgi:hypothetical protein
VINVNLSNKSIQENLPPFIEVELPSLSETEQGERQKLEQIIKDQAMGFYPLGCAFKEIMLKKLYRSIFKTFEEYCKSEFDMTVRLVNYLMSASDVMDNLRQNQNNCSVLPSRESQVRPLASLTPEQQIEVWTKAVEESDGKVPTAKTVKNVANIICAHEDQRRILMSSETQKICKAIETLHQFDVGKIRQAILDLETQGLDLATLAIELTVKFQNLELT